MENDHLNFDVINEGKSIKNNIKIKLNKNKNRLLEKVKKIKILEDSVNDIQEEIDSLNKIKYELVDKLEKRIKIIPQEVISKEIISEENILENFSAESPSEIQKNIDNIENSLNELALAKEITLKEIYNEESEKKILNQEIKTDENKIEGIEEKINNIEKNNFIPKILLILIILYLIKNMLKK